MALDESGKYIDDDDYVLGFDDDTCEHGKTVAQYCIVCDKVWEPRPLDFEDEDAEC